MLVEDGRMFADVVVFEDQWRAVSASMVDGRWSGTQ